MYHYNSLSIQVFFLILQMAEEGQKQLIINNQAGAMQYSPDKLFLLPLGVQLFEGSQFAPLRSIRCYLNRFTYHQSLQTLNWCAGNQQSLPSVRLLSFCVILQISSVLRYSTQDIGSSNQFVHTFSKIKKLQIVDWRGVGKFTEEEIHGGLLKTEKPHLTQEGSEFNFPSNILPISSVIFVLPLALLFLWQLGLGTAGDGPMDIYSHIAHLSNLIYSWVLGKNLEVHQVPQ